MFRKTVAALTLAAALAIPATAHDGVTPKLDDPISLRMIAMKQVGAGIGALAAMAKQEAPFDAGLAHMSLRAMLAAAVGYGKQFPEGSETGLDTRAAPAIWSDRAGFEAELAAFIADLDALVAQPPADLAAVGPALGRIGDNCTSCHEGYRVERN